MVHTQNNNTHIDRKDGTKPDTYVCNNRIRRADNYSAQEETRHEGWENTRRPTKTRQSYSQDKSRQWNGIEDHTNRKIRQDNEKDKTTQYTHKDQTR